MVGGIPTCRRHRRVDASSWGGRKECINCIIVQHVVGLLVCRAVHRAITAVVPHDCCGLRPSDTRGHALGVWLVWLARGGGLLAVAKVCIQTHDNILVAREAFQHIAESAVRVEDSPGTAG